MNLDDVIIQIALHLNKCQAVTLSLTNRRFYTLILKNQNYWRLKFLKDYPDEMPSDVADWYKYYINYRTVYALGDLITLKITKSKDIHRIWDHPCKFVTVSSLGGCYFIDMQGNVNIYGNNRQKYYNVATKLPLTGKMVAANENAIVLGSDNRIVDKTAYISIPDMSIRYLDISDRYAIFIGDDDMLILFRDDEVISTNIRAKYCSCGPYHIAVIDVNGNLLMSGSNVDGQLGLDNVYKTDQLITVPNFKAKQVSCGHYHTAIIDQDDYLTIFANNQKNKYTDLICKQISCGMYHTSIIDINDNLYIIGCIAGIVYDRLTRIGNIQALQVKSSRDMCVFIVKSL